ncbi:MAG: leucine-rich repeat domain-containing protein [Alphaproteobacteria bacterium]|nr:leucine-rich repeat domain-containing protein [Alphaproteobacteria bacterium]
MKYYLFLFCLFASSSSMALMDDKDESGKRPFSQGSDSSPEGGSAKRSRNKGTESTREQQPSSSCAASSSSTDIPEPFFSEVHTLNSLLDFNAVLENPAASISRLKFNFTPTVDQLSFLTKQVPFLSALDLSATDVTNDEIRPLLTLDNLKYLDLSSTNVRNVEAIFNSQGQETATLELENNVLRPSSHPNLSINLQYTIRAPLVAEEEVPEEYFDGFIRLNQLRVSTPEELYEKLNNSANEPRDRKWGELTFLYAPSLKQLQHILMMQPHLRLIDLSGTPISDVSPLSKLPALGELKLRRTAISDLSYFSEFPALSELDLSGTAITNAEASSLGGVTNLYHLNLSDTAVTDVSYLPEKLVTLDLKNTKITDVLSLTNLINLYCLYLNNTKIKDISPLFSLTELEELDLSDTAVTDISPLVSFTNLSTLDLSGTPITDAGIPLLASLPNLGALDLSGTAITDAGIPLLASLPNLRALDLRDTAVTDISPLADRQNLKFHTNIGVLRRGTRPSAIEKYYYMDMLRKAPPTAIPLTQSADNTLKRVASKAEEYLRSTKAERETYLRY